MYDNVPKIYFRDIKKWKPLCSEREYELAKRIQEGDLLAEKELIQANLRFVIRVATNYLNQGLDIQDLISEGNIGLINAARKFKGEKNIRFISYAVWWIRQAIILSLSNYSQLTHIPTNKFVELNKYRKVYVKLEQKFHRAPSLEELSESTGFSIEQIINIESMLLAPIYIDKPIDGESDSETLANYLPDTRKNFVEDIEDNSVYCKLVKFLDVLPDRNRDIIKKYYGIGGEMSMTLDEISKKVGLTRERVRQIRDRTLEGIKASHRFKNFIKENILD